MYIQQDAEGFVFDLVQFKKDIPIVVRAMDMVIDKAIYPLPEQEAEAQEKRRMGLGVMGLANCIEAILDGPCYGEPLFILQQESILQVFRDEVYRASIELAKEKGPFPKFDRDKYCEGKFIKTLPEDIQEGIYKHGIRNSHLLSIAPTGTISLACNNVSSGIEPVVAHDFSRVVQKFDGPVTIKIKDYGYDTFGIKGRTIQECSVRNHLDVLLTAQKYMDSAVSKTCNVPQDIPWNDFKNVYMQAWEGGAKGCTTFRMGGKREGILKVSEGQCYIDNTTGRKECT